MATHSSTLAWKIPWSEEPGRLQSMGLQRVRHDWATNTFTFMLLKLSDPHQKNGDDKIVPAVYLFCESKLRDSCLTWSKCPRNTFLGALTHRAKHWTHDPAEIFSDQHSWLSNVILFSSFSSETKSSPQSLGLHLPQVVFIGLQKAGASGRWALPHHFPGPTQGPEGSLGLLLEEPDF